MLRLNVVVIESVIRRHWSWIDKRICVFNAMKLMHYRSLIGWDWVEMTIFRGSSVGQRLNISSLFPLSRSILSWLSIWLLKYGQNLHFFLLQDGLWKLCAIWSAKSRISWVETNTHFPFVWCLLLVDLTCWLCFDCWICYLLLSDYGWRFLSGCIRRSVEKIRC